MLRSTTNRRGDDFDVATGLMYGALHLVVSLILYIIPKRTS